MIVGKVWGTTECLFEHGMAGYHRLHINPNYQCSLHKHNTRSNAFIVISGKLFIDVVKKAYKLTDTTELGPGEMTVVPPGEYHRFRTGDEPCVCIESYHPHPLGSDDIDREDVGGPIDNA